MQWLILVAVGLITIFACQSFFNAQQNARTSTAAKVSQPAERTGLFTRRSKRKARVLD
jgi:hypothetical protein